MNRKRTKIVATISDRMCDVELLRELYEAGMNVVRINTAHQSPEDSLKVIKNVREVSEKIAILLDTKGPEVRTNKSELEIKVIQGQRIMIKGNPAKESNRECLYVSYDRFVNDVPEGSNILIDDGDIELKVVKKNKDTLLCEVCNSGVIQSRKSVNVPKVSMNLPPLSDKDRIYVHFAVENNLDFIAHSFVRSKEDVSEIQKILDKYKSPIKIIAKIENKDGVDNIDEILDNVYGIMVARGDLAIEIPYEKIPGIQNMIIRKCIALRKPVIIATQMLHSMIHNPRPTRAEISDVANSIYGQTDAVMLSGETACGKYPVRSVETITRVAIQAELDKEEFYEAPTIPLSTEITGYLSKSAVKASIRLNAGAIIADTVKGNTIRNLSGFRGIKTIFAQCYLKKTMRELALSYGVEPHYMELEDTSHELFIYNALDSLISSGIITEKDLVVVLAGNFGPGPGASYIEITTAENLRSGDIPGIH